MRGLLSSHLKKHFAIGITLAIVGALGVKVFIYDARKTAYANFYKTYDVQKDFERMRELGVFHSVRPVGESGSE